jgi:hypothetical protein
MGCVTGKRRATVETINNFTVPMNLPPRQKAKLSIFINKESKVKPSTHSDHWKKPLDEKALKTIFEVGSYLEVSLNVE